MSKTLVQAGQFDSNDMYGLVVVRGIQRIRHGVNGAKQRQRCRRMQYAPSVRLLELVKLQTYLRGIVNALNAAQSLKTNTPALV